MAQQKQVPRTDSVELVHKRNEFYRRNYRRLMTAVLVLVVINIVLASVVGWLVTHPKRPTYFATTNSGNVIPLFPLNIPLVTRQAMIEWSSEAATRAYTYDFVNYRRQLQANARFFTAKGWDNFLSTLKASAQLNTIESKQLNVTATPSRQPVILRQGLVGGQYAWRVQVPLVVAFQSASQRLVQNVMVTLLVKRISTIFSPKGIGIDQFIATEQSVAAGS